MSSKKNRSRSLARVQPQQKDNPNVAVVVSQQGVGTPATMPRNMRAYIQEGYRSSKTVFRVVGHIARTGAGIKWKHYADKTKKRDLGETELLKLWENPSPGVAGSAFREAMLAYYCMTGNNYLLGINAANNPRGKFDELYNLRPDLTKIKVDDAGPQYYEFGTFTPPKRYDPLQVMHNKLFAGNDDVYGLSPIEVAAMLIDLQKAGQKWNLGLMSNMARPGGAWVTDALLGDTEYKGLKDEIRKKFAGPRNAGETAILHGGVKWQSMSMSPMELDWLESDTKTDRDIAGIFFNFPLFLLGLADSTYQNQSEARFALYTEIEFPLLDMFEASLNMWLSTRYGGYLGYAQDDVEAIQERLQQAKVQASERADTEFTGGTTTFLEAREIQGKNVLAVKDFVMIGTTPVHVEDLDDYIEAMAGKTISPPPPPPMLPPPGKTTVTEIPNDDNDNADATDNSDTSSGGSSAHQSGNSGSGKSLEDNRRQRLMPPARHLVKALDLSTTEQKQAYFKSVEAQRGKWEADITGRLQDYFKSESRTILAAIGNAVDGDSASAKVDHALQVLQQQGTLKHLIVSLYQDVGTDSGEQVAKELKHDYSIRAIERKDTQGNGRDLNLYSPDVLVYLLTLAGEKVKYINTSTQAELQAALAEGVQAGESIIQLAKRIDDLYLLQIIPDRSKVISATEVVAASNFGSQEAAKASGLTLNKVWLATEDGHTRPDHRAADGQKVGMDEPFTVGGDQLMFPGDNSLGAAADQIVRCRCTQYYERVQDESATTQEDNTNKSLLLLTTPTRETYRSFMRTAL